VELRAAPWASVGVRLWGGFVCGRGYDQPRLRQEWGAFSGGFRRTAFAHLLGADAQKAVEEGKESSRVARGESRRLAKRLDALGPPPARAGTGGFSCRHVACCPGCNTSQDVVAGVAIPTQRVEERRGGYRGRVPY